ncbi:unnamed protein product [marine sediment metagenome]|uniref:Uncharacterized protein n=1 Tax=marine sediment metagenome TaxID=412755 RepID=X0S864_9ZZZZ
MKEDDIILDLTNLLKPKSSHKIKPLEIRLSSEQEKLSKEIGIYLKERQEKINKILNEYSIEEVIKFIDLLEQNDKFLGKSVRNAFFI